MWIGGLQIGEGLKEAVSDGVDELMGKVVPTPTSNGSMTSSPSPPPPPPEEEEKENNNTPVPTTPIPNGLLNFLFFYYTFMAFLIENRRESCYIT